MSARVKVGDIIRIKPTQLCIVSKNRNVILTGHGRGNVGVWDHIKINSAIDSGDAEVLFNLIEVVDGG